MAIHIPPTRTLRVGDDSEYLREVLAFEQEKKAEVIYNGDLRAAGIQRLSEKDGGKKRKPST